ncbi:MAG: rRNA maturation RNase YbeY [Bacteroidales bacterium]|nr:rRNA maturation RNase YbeY [Bacteroidales bacterium]
MAISFSCADLDFELVDEKLKKKWISSVVNHYGMHLGRITYLFCSDEYVYKANMKYLNHDTYTDIITFDCVEGNLISGDIMISVDRVKDNAVKFSIPFERELSRVIIHGVLHLLGYKDKTDTEAAEMRQKENDALAMLDALS